MGSKSSFITGFEKRAAFVAKLKALKAPVLTMAGVGGAAYAGGKAMKAGEDPEQAAQRAARERMKGAQGGY